MSEKVKIGIIGAARSGIAAAKLAKRKGFAPFVSDMRKVSEMQEIADELRKLEIEFEFGKHEEIFNSDRIIVSPGVPLNSPVVLQAKEKGIEIIGEIEFAFEFAKCKIIAITGTNGKTTTTMLTSHLLDTAGLGNKFAGNIGIAFSEVVDLLGENDFAVLELSSFQLDAIKNFKPEIAALLNVTPDHLNRYENKFENYVASKFRIAENQTVEDYFIINAGDETILRNLPAVKSRVFGFSISEKLVNGAFAENGKLFFAESGTPEEICEIKDLALKGEHNLMNFLAVAVIAKILKIENETIAKAFSTFENVEHRLEFVREINGVKFINDSKATNTVSTYYALRSFEVPVRLILGGRDKGNDYGDILDEVKRRVVKIYTTGESAEKIYKFFSKEVETEIYSSFEEMVRSANEEAEAGEVVLLSPACASFDLFESYEERGKVFKKIVNGL